MDADDLAQDGIRFWEMSQGDTPVGCGALKLLDDGTAEVKSVHVVHSVRGRGLAREMMTYLAKVAHGEGISALVLETGSDRLPGYAAARGLYEALGYEYCDPIPGYAPDPNSAFMRLNLETGGG